MLDKGVPQMVFDYFHRRSRESVVCSVKNRQYKLLQSLILLQIINCQPFLLQFGSRKMATMTFEIVVS